MVQNGDRRKACFRPHILAIHFMIQLWCFCSRTAEYLDLKHKILNEIDRMDGNCSNYTSPVKTTMRYYHYRYFLQICHTPF